MNIREISTARLREYENNPRNNDLAVEKVKYSIERFGFLFPVVVDMNYTIVAGHTRVRACRELGIQSVPCIIADELTDEQINLFRLVDNKTAEYSDWDFEKLKTELSMVDLTLDENQLLLDRFELTAEVFDIEAEQAEIKIPAFNFMGVNEQPKPKRPTVKTINNPANDEVGAVDDEVETTAPVYETPAYHESVSAQVALAENSPSDDKVLCDNVTTSTDELGMEQKETKPALPIYQFRFGDVAFFISKIELNRLNDRYSEYIDSGVALERSFADYLLEEVENRD